MKTRCSPGVGSGQIHFFCAVGDSKKSDDFFAIASPFRKTRRIARENWPFAEDFWPLEALSLLCERDFNRGGNLVALQSNLVLPAAVESHEKVLQLLEFLEEKGETSGGA